MSEKILSVGIYTLGCKVNQYESEAISEALEEKGFSVFKDGEGYDISIINTCTVTAESDRKCRQLIRRLISANPSSYIIVTGCLAQTSPDELAKLDGVDFICGNSKKLSIVAAALSFAENQKKGDMRIDIEPIDTACFEKMSIRKFDRTRAYVKIEDGCENRCSYCIIPSARGNIRSKPPKEVISEVRDLIDGGCREIVLTGIETASYGRDLGNCDLAELLVEVDKLGCDRIRLGSLDPSLIKDSFVSKIASLGSLTPHFHLSLQSGSDRILALMRRKYNSKMAFDRLTLLRNSIPGVMFTTDIIVGFPGETEEDFLSTVEFVRKARFLSAHIFQYSKRKGTLAADMADQVPTDIKSRRSAELTVVQNSIRHDILASEAESKNEHDVLFETYSRGYAIGHTRSFIEVAVKSPRPLHSEIQRVRITDLDTSGKTERCLGIII